MRVRRTDRRWESMDNTSTHVHRPVYRYLHLRHIHTHGRTSTLMSSTLSETELTPLLRATRHALVVIHNFTDQALPRGEVKMLHGTFATLPPERIAPKQSRCVGVASLGVLVGVECALTYGDTSLYVCAPFAGRAWTAVAAPPRAARFELRHCVRRNTENSVLECHFAFVPNSNEQPVLAPPPHDAVEMARLVSSGNGAMERRCISHCRFPLLRCCVASC